MEVKGINAGAEVKIHLLVNVQMQTWRGRLGATIQFFEC